jgi:uncharacterized protein YggL (DUF469 family)
MVSLRRCRDEPPVTAPCPEFGFTVVMKPLEPIDAHALEALCDAWIDFLERRGLCCGGGGDGTCLEYAIASEASQATDSDREAVMEWLRARRDVESWNVGALIDLRESD